jgi:hypothetical protein
MTRSSRPVGVFLTNKEAASFLRLSPRTLEKHRTLNSGPRYRKFGRRVLYALQDLEAYTDTRWYGRTKDSVTGR